jgi:hypothetical protein
MNDLTGVGNASENPIAAHSFSASFLRISAGEREEIVGQMATNSPTLDQKVALTGWQEGREYPRFSAR